jgi:predicted O-methyltransferase YrrM
MVTDDIEQYLLKHSSPESELLAELRRETHLKTVYPQMLSGPVQGKLLELISRMVKPEKILEIGTFTGYSTLCLEKGLTQGGKLHTIEVNPEMAEFAARFFKKGDVQNRIVQHLGDAMKIIPGLKESFDIVFIDAGKEHYPEYYKLVFDKVNVGGYFIVDNVLWSGKVLSNQEKMDNETAGINELNQLLVNDKRIEVAMLPLRDGLSIACKVSD